MITSTPFLHATPRHFKFTPNMMPSTYNLASCIPHRWMLITPTTKWIEWRFFTPCTTIYLCNTTSNTPVQSCTWIRACKMPTLNSRRPIIWTTTTLYNLIFVNAPYVILTRSKTTSSSLHFMQRRTAPSPSQ